MSPRKTVALLALLLLAPAYARAQATVPLIPNPLLAVVMAESSHKFVIVMFHRNGPETGALGALVGNAIMRDPVLAPRALLASAEVGEEEGAMLAKDFGVTRVPTLVVATIHKNADSTSDLKVYVRVKLDLDANTLRTVVMLGLCQNKEAAQQPYFDAGMRSACDGYLNGRSSVTDLKVPEGPPLPRARFSKRPDNPVKVAIESIPFTVGKGGDSLLSSFSTLTGPPPPADVLLPRAKVDPEAAHLSGVWKGKALINVCGKQSGTADITLTLADAGFWAGIWSDKNQQKGRVTGKLTVNGAEQGSVIALYGHTRLETDDLAIATRALQASDDEEYSPYSLRLTAEAPYWSVGYYQTLSGILHRGSQECTNWLDRGESLGVTLRKQ